MLVAILSSDILDCARSHMILTRSCMNQTRSHMRSHMIHDAFKKGLDRVLEERLQAMMAVCVYIDRCRSEQLQDAGVLCTP